MKTAQAKTAHSGTSTPFMIGVLVIVLLPVLMATGTVQKLIPFAQGGHTANNTFSTNPPYTPPQSTSEPIPSGEYAGWTQYHHNALGFSVNIPPDINVDELPQTRAEKPRYPEFMLQLSYSQAGSEIEVARVTVYDSKLSVNTSAQELSTDPLFAAKPTKQAGTLNDHQSVQYFYQGDVRTVVYLIDNGAKTFEIRGSVDTTDPTAVTNYWNSFNHFLNSFAID